MGHCVYLTARTSDAETELFEAKNFLPFFWLTLLDQHLLADCEKWWLQEERLAQENENEYERFADIWPPLTAIVLDRPALHQNRARTRLFLEKHFPQLVETYQEFNCYLLAQLPGEDDQLQLDINALAAFTSAAEYHAGLLAQVAALDQQAPWRWGEPGLELLDLTGFASVAVFPEAYPALRQLTQRRMPSVAGPAAPTRRTSRKPVSQFAPEERVDATFGLLMLVLFVVISVGAYKFTWQEKTYGFPLPFCKLPAASPPEWHLGALALDLPLTAFLAWHLRGLGQAVGELVRYWRGR